MRKAFNRLFVRNLRLNDPQSVAESGHSGYWKTIFRSDFGPYFLAKVKIVESFVDYLVPLALLAVLFVLGFGLINMMRGGSPNLSQKLMRWRVLLQFFALVAVMLAIWMKSRS